MIFKKPNGVWAIDFTDKRVGRVALSARTTKKAEANRREAILRALVDQGEYDIVRRVGKGLHIVAVQAAVEAGDVSALRARDEGARHDLGAAIDRYLEDVHGSRERGTWEGYCSILRGLGRAMGVKWEREGAASAGRIIADVPMHPITSDRLTEWLREPKEGTRGGAPWAPKRQKVARAVVGKLWKRELARAVEWADVNNTAAALTRNPVASTEAPRIRQTRVEFLRPAEWRTLSRVTFCGAPGGAAPGDGGGTGSPESAICPSREVITSAEERHEVTRSSASRAKAAIAPLKQERDRIQLRLDTAMESLTAAAGGEAFRRRREAELETARLEGALRERGREEVQFELPTDAAVVQAAYSEAKAAFDSARGDLLDRLNEEILRLGNAFGVHGLEMVNLNSNAQMRLQKGGESTSFSKLTAGERLRLRIATAIALLRVGRERGVGRHPGLLIIDSPGAEETSESDLTTLLKELQHVASETEGLQILIASADAPAVIAALGTDKCRIAPPGEKLW